MRKTIKKTKTKAKLNLGALTEPGCFGDHTSSSSSCTGECTDYCRCTTISNARVTELYHRHISDAVIPHHMRNTIFGYCVERVLRFCGVMDASNWEVNIVGGYYGEETSGILLDYSTRRVANDHIVALSRLTDQKRMEYVLQLEYGYLLPALCDKQWVIKKILKKNIVVGNTDHYDRKLYKTIVEGYEGHEFPIAVCIFLEDAGVYRLIDGYHRFSAVDSGARQISIVVAV